MGSNARARVISADEKGVGLGRNVSSAAIIP
jgi:hypothetical protein